jgi:hypothetical protein
LPEQTGPDLVRLAEVLDRHGVEYLVVGGVAARAHGASRPTQDLDCLVRRGRENLERLAAALVELHAHLRVSGLTEDEMAALPVQLDAETLARTELSTWRTDAGDLDLLSDIPDSEGSRRRYEDLVANSSRIDSDGVSVRVASLQDVIASKEWANRAKDQEALPELRQLGRERDQASE